MKLKRSFNETDQSERCFLLGKDKMLYIITLYKKGYFLKRKNTTPFIYYMKP